MDFRNFFGNKTSPSPADTMELTKPDLYTLKISATGHSRIVKFIEFYIQGSETFEVDKITAIKSVQQRLNVYDESWGILEPKQEKNRWFIVAYTFNNKTFQAFRNTFEDGIQLESTSSSWIDWELPLAVPQRV